MYSKIDALVILLSIAATNITITTKFIVATTTTTTFPISPCLKIPTYNVTSNGKPQNSLVYYIEKTFRKFEFFNSNRHMASQGTVMSISFFFITLYITDTFHSSLFTFFSSYQCFIFITLIFNFILFLYILQA